MQFSDFIDGGRLAAGGLKDFAAGFVTPTLRLGVTGLSRSGKTVFITALVHALLNGTRLAMFEPQARGIIHRVYLEPQPDDSLPRFAYEDNLAAMKGEDRHWPESTRRISQLRLTIDFEPQGLIARNIGRGRLHVDIVDYPGEWLLDLPLMNMDYAEWSASTLATSRKPPRDKLAKDWHVFLSPLDADADANEAQAVKAALVFTSYLARCRADGISLSTLPPGRFLMPGDLEGSPMLTFAPLDIAADAEIRKGSLAALMQRRYDAYVSKIVKPFFFHHFARLDRQIVLVDTLTALNAGADAVNDLGAALTDVLSCFRQGKNSILSGLLGRRINRILFAATKADLVHHASHDRLEAILRAIVSQAMARAEYAGAAIDVAAIAAIRATREARVTQKGEELACIAGIPEAGEKIGGTGFNGETEAAIFPGDLPSDPKEALEGKMEGSLHFVKFRPPLAKDGHYGHIRLDRAIEFLIGDRIG
ncbi:MAG: YcjX family protein [Aestuariivirga sp.]